MKKLTAFWLEFLKLDQDDNSWWSRKKRLSKERNVEIIRVSGDGHMFQKLSYDKKTDYQYLLSLTFLMKQKDRIYLEQQVSLYQFNFLNGKISNHTEIRRQPKEEGTVNPLKTDSMRTGSEQRFIYDRLAAVKYAERWWNSYNPDFQKFGVDCTNYVSQCLLAGGAPMRGTPIRDQGWWYRTDNWSFSWAVAHSMRWYLSGSIEGLQGKEVETPNELYPGDLICYDFQGDGRWDHNTFVVAKDANGMPLVNAHTDNSRHRYWSYEDSTAWTPTIKYKFFRIGES